MNLLILAGGRGTRMSHYTAGNHYPKLLLSIGNETVLDSIMRRYAPYFDRVGIVFSEESHGEMLYKWLHNYHEEAVEHLDLIPYEKTDGTFNTIKSVLSRYPAYETDTLFHWSDIMLTDRDLENLIKTIPTVKKLDGIIAIDQDTRHRLDFSPQRQEITASANATGNIPGIYYIKSMRDILSRTAEGPTEVDFANVLGAALEDGEMILGAVSCRVIDLGDGLKYETYMRDASESTAVRYFNKITIDREAGTVTKAANCEKGRQVMEAEVKFYGLANSHGWPMPVVKKYDPVECAMTMDLVDGQTVFQYLNQVDPHRTNFEIAEQLIQKYEKAIEKIHFGTSEIEPQLLPFNSDVEKEYIDVMIGRVYEIEYLLPPDIFEVEVDGDVIEIGTFGSMLKRLRRILKSRCYVMSTIHGDTNSSNTMMEYNGRVTFIDPRGKFGDSELVGDIMYDIAKFIYGLHAYDMFNRDPYFRFDIDKKDKRITMNMNHYGYALDELVGACESLNEGDREFVCILVGLIFVKLTAYIKNNPSKAIASYYYGMKLMEEYMTQYERKHNTKIHTM